MLLAVVTVILVVVGAVALAVIAEALGPEAGRFPCARPEMRWMLRVYAFALFIRAAVLTAQLQHGSQVAITPDLFFGAAAMCTCHCGMLVLLLRARLPVGVWARLERRLSIERRAASQR